MRGFNAEIFKLALEMPSKSRVGDPFGNSYEIVRVLDRSVGLEVDLLLLLERNGEQIIGWAGDHLEFESFMKETGFRIPLGYQELKIIEINDVEVDSFEYDRALEVFRKFIINCHLDNSRNHTNLENIVEELESEVFKSPTRSNLEILETFVRTFESINSEVFLK